MGNINGEIYEEEVDKGSSRRQWLHKEALKMKENLSDGTTSPMSRANFETYVRVKSCNVITQS